MSVKLKTPFHDWLVALRRTFHQYPELGYQEVKTAEVIASVLRELGVPYHGGVGGTGLIAVLDAARPGPTLALRGDMDALPIEELNNVPYKSKYPGKMHACGHDGHITLLLGTIRRLIEQDWPQKGRGRVLFIFQPAEEGGAGATAMLESGLFEQEKIAAIFAAHMHPELPAGEIELAKGVSNASSAAFHLRLTGTGGHGAHPHLCADPIVAGAHLVTAMQSIVSRNVSPLQSAVITVGRFQAGVASNVIPREALLDGTIRTLDEATRALVVERLGELTAGLEKSHRVHGELTVNIGYPVLVNDLEMVEFCLREAEKLLGASAVKVGTPRMGAEDFAFFLQRYPGVLIRLGCHNPEIGYLHGLHSPYFDFDEGALDVGVRLFGRLLTEFGG